MTTKLPSIHKRDGMGSADFARNAESRGQNEAGDNKEYISPFRLPTDDEVFVYREVERKKKDELKQMGQDLKIWDKQTGTSRRPLRLFKDFEVNSKENQKSSRGGYTVKEKAMIVEAQRIIAERRKSRDTNGKERKEGVVEMLEQKKEMFLVEMTVGIIEKEREVLIQKANEKDDALKKSDDMLEKDWKEFDGYKQNNKQETDQAIQKYNQEVEQRKRTETEYKIKNNDLTSLKAEKTKNEEFIQKYLDAKTFLQKLTPKEVLEQRERELRQKVEEFKQRWMEHEISHRDESLSAVSESMYKSGALHGHGGHKKTVDRKKHHHSDIEKVFQEYLDRGEFDEIEEFRLSQKIYFQDPEQLVELFTRLEEGNLYLIQSMQDTEQALENLKTSLKLKKIEFDKKIGGLRENKATLERNKAEKEEKVRNLQARAYEPKLAKSHDGLVPLRKKILEVASRFRDEGKGNIDQDTLLTLDLLASIELHLEKQLEKLNEYKPSLIVEWKRKFEDARKKANRKLQLEREQKLAEERSRKASERVLEKTKKRKGRMDMKKSTPLEKEEVVEEEEDSDEDDKDTKYFMPYLTKF